MARKRKKDTATGKLFSEPQSEIFDESEEERAQRDKSKKIECLGLTFDSDEERRAYFLERLKENLTDPEFRRTAGFPKGNDEAILALSDPPYYTACPNPFLGDLLQWVQSARAGDVRTSSEPFAADVSEGKNDPLYNVHSYHTKVPYKAIQRYVKHYLPEGGVVLDCYSGSGMTGLAVSMLETEPCNSTTERYLAILVDLSPAATSISSGYALLGDCTPRPFLETTEELLAAAEAEVGYLYQTKHLDGSSARIDYTIWSDVLVCPHCAGELTFWNVAVDDRKKSIRSTFRCSNCSTELSKRHTEHARERLFDVALGKPITRNKQIPVQISYRIDRVRYHKEPDTEDIQLLRQLETQPSKYWYPTNRMMDAPEEVVRWGDKWRAGTSNFKYVHELYTRRQLEVLAFLWNRIMVQSASEVRELLRFVFTATSMRHSRMNTFRFNVSFPSNVTLGTLYVASLVKETNYLEQFRNKARRRVAPHLRRCGPRRVFVSTQSANDLSVIPSGSVDYVFVDPPFGDNLAYAELNFGWEAWLRVFTAISTEAIVSPHQKKSLHDYQVLMKQSFDQLYRVLKPGRWLTVEFHNTRNAVWSAIQEALSASGFVVADVRLLDKQGASFNAVKGSGAVKHDLVISAYKPPSELLAVYQTRQGDAEAAYEFVRTHLAKLPVFVAQDDQCKVIGERQMSLLFDRMVAFHVQHGLTVPLGMAEFTQGLTQRLPERDGMYFLPEQVAEYDKKRAKVEKLQQLSLFVNDEATAIQWVRQQLQEKPRSFQDLQPQFMKELQAWAKHERTIELRDILQENFLCYEGKERVPEQIHSYLSTNFKDCRKLEKQDPKLKVKAMDRWYVPDPGKQGDLEALRSRRLLAEFEEYKTAKQKKIKRFRSEAVRAGFKAAYDEQDYETIVRVGDQLDEKVLQEDEKLLMYYDVASTRLGG